MGDGNIFIFRIKKDAVTLGEIGLVEISLSTFLSTGHERGVCELLQWSECVHRQRCLFYFDDEDIMEAMMVLELYLLFTY